MRFLGAGETANMDAQKRDDILSLISAGREIEAAALLHPRVVMSSSEAPVDAGTMALAASMKSFDTHDPVVRAIDRRLRLAPGPTYRDLSRQESQALSAWAQAADSMGQTVQDNVASSSGGTGMVVLIVLAVGAILSTVLLSGGGTPDTGLPTRFGGYPPRPSVGPSARPTNAASTGLFPGEGRGSRYGREGGWAMHRAPVPPSSQFASEGDEV